MVDQDDIIELQPRDMCSAFGFERGMLLEPIRSRVFRRELVLIDPRVLLWLVLSRDVWLRLDRAGLHPVWQRVGNPFRLATLDGRLVDRDEAPDGWPDVVRIRIDLVERRAEAFGTHWVDRSRIDEPVDYTFPMTGLLLGRPSAA